MTSELPVGHHCSLRAVGFWMLLAERESPHISPGLVLVLLARLEPLSLGLSQGGVLDSSSLDKPSWMS